MIVGVLIGLLAAAVGLAVGELLAALTDPAYGPIAVVSSSAIDLPPAVVKEWAVSTFGTAAKGVVVASVTLVALAVAVVGGIVALRRPGRGALIAVLTGVIGAIAGVRRPEGGLAAILPPLIAGLAAGAVVWTLARMLQRRTDPPATTTGVGRRQLLLSAGAFAAVAAGAWTAARYLGDQASATASRLAARLPAPVFPAPPLPPGVDAPIEGLYPFTTPNVNFYRIDTAVVIPQVRAEEWSLEFTGMVRRPFRITYDELLAMPMVERDITIMCVSNPIGGGYIGNARWLGTPLMPLLERAGIESGADQLLSTSVDGWTCSTPLAGLGEREPLLVVGMNGEPLPVRNGFPARLVIPGLYGFISATKWIARIEATTYAAATAYWTDRGWATDAPVLTGARIDQPNEGTMRAGASAIGGVAWAMDGEGISKVEVQVDDGPWLEAELAAVPNDVTWRQWWLPWVATPGMHRIGVRATNGLGELQTSVERDVVPDGATGYHRITVDVVA